MLGRKRLPENQRRKQKINLSLTDEEYKRIIQAKNRGNIDSPTAFVRKIVLDHIDKT